MGQSEDGELYIAAQLVSDAGCVSEVMATEGPWSRSMLIDRGRTLLYDDGPGTEVDWVQAEPGSWTLKDLQVRVLHFQTALGIAAELDRWEQANLKFRRRHDLDGKAPVSWRVQLAAARGSDWRGVVQKMIERLTRVGMENHIRRAVGREVEFGSLGQLCRGDEDWFLRFPDQMEIWFAVTNWPSLAEVTDPDEGLTLLAAGLSSGTENSGRSGFLEAKGD